MSDRIELKVGDRVRLLGKAWETIKGIPYGTVVTVDSTRIGISWSTIAGSLVSADGTPYYSFPIEKVEDADDSNEQAAADARVLTEIRAYYTLLAVDGHGASVTLTMRELGILLRIADEYQALKRSLVDGDES